MWFWFSIIALILIVVLLGITGCQHPNKKEMLGLGLALIFIYPLDRMQSAGWGATTVNYIWPFAMAMFACIGLKKIWNKEKISKIL